MSWTITSVGKSSSTNGNRGNVFMRATETLTVATSDSAGQDLTGSVIDFIPAGKDWVLLSNTGATDLSSDADVAIHACGTATGTFALLKDDLETTIDDAMKSSVYDNSANGEAPYYKIVVDSDGVQKKTDTVAFEILVYGGARD